MQRKDLLGLEDLTAAEIEDLLDRGLHRLRTPPTGDGPAADHLSVVNLILEPSTRTRCSFELAEQRLGVERLTISEGSSLIKGETLIDTARTLAAMGVNTFVLRHRKAGTPRALAAQMPDAHVINAGDGAGEHPTQGLLDLLTLRQAWGSLAGRTLLVVGDIVRSRVARSNYHGLTKLDGKIVLCGPPEYLPAASEFPDATVTDELDAVIGGVDAVMALRIQNERFEAGDAKLRVNEYRERYGITVARADRLPPGVPILHPGPFNRDVEIDGAVADGDRALIWRQVTAGVAIRIGILEALAERRAGTS